jgi:hypothetical protein
VFLQQFGSFATALSLALQFGVSNPAFANAFSIFNWLVFFVLNVTNTDFVIGFN